MTAKKLFRVIKRTTHKVLAFCGLEAVRRNSKIEIQRRSYIGSDYLNDISKIAGGKRNIHVCIDGGAHHGETALTFADAFPKATIYSFEPERNNYLTLQEAVSSHKRISPAMMALGEMTESGIFTVNYDSQTGSLLCAAKGSGKYVVDPRMMQPSSMETVAITTLSEFAKKNSIDSIDLLKLDLQGYELKALQGAKSLLHSKRILFILLEVNFVPAYEGQATLTELYDYCTNIGYRLVGLYPSEFDASKFHYRCGGDLLFVLENLNEYNKNDPTVR